VLHNYLLYHPFVSAKEAARVMDVAYNTANNIIKNLENEGILEETTGQSRNRRYAYAEYLRILAEGTTPTAS
jgi:Fic family protein